MLHAQTAAWLKSGLFISDNNVQTAVLVEASIYSSHHSI